jgi:hypothetical protein
VPYGLLFWAIFVENHALAGVPPLRSATRGIRMVSRASAKVIAGRITVARSLSCSRHCQAATREGLWLV